jgi:hypothetical protein
MKPITDCRTEPNAITAATFENSYDDMRVLKSSEIEVKLPTRIVLEMWTPNDSWEFKRKLDFLELAEM